MTDKFVCVALSAVSLFSCRGAEWESYRLVTRRTPEPVPGLVNADFEDHSKFGPSEERKKEKR